MTSAIDPSKPGSPVAYTADVRANFSAAKSEIEALQAVMSADPLHLTATSIILEAGSSYIAMNDDGVGTSYLGGPAWIVDGPGIQGMTDFEISTPASKHLNLSTANTPDATGSGDISLTTGNSLLGNSGNVTLKVGVGGFDDGRIVLDGLVSLKYRMEAPSGLFLYSDANVVDIRSGEGGNYAALYSSNDSTGAGSGIAYLYSGEVTAAGPSGVVSIFTGNAVDKTGDVQFITGNASAGPSGDIRLTTGTATTTKGRVLVDADLTMQPTRALTLSGAPTSSLHAATKQYVDAGQAYTLAAYAAGTLTASQVILMHRFPSAVTFPTNFGITTSGGSSTAGSSANATASTVLTVARCTGDPTNPANFFNIGTITFAAGGHSGAFVTTLAGSFNAGDTLRLIGPATPDATLAGIHVTLVGNR